MGLTFTKQALHLFHTFFTKNFAGWVVEKFSQFLLNARICTETILAFIMIDLVDTMLSCNNELQFCRQVSLVGSCARGGMLDCHSKRKLYYSQF
jgi:hypothetical protein